MTPVAELFPGEFTLWVLLLLFFDVPSPLYVQLAFEERGSLEYLSMLRLVVGKVLFEVNIESAFEQGLFFCGASGERFDVLWCCRHLLLEVYWLGLVLRCFCVWHWLVALLLPLLQWSVTSGC